MSDKLAPAAEAVASEVKGGAPEIDRDKVRTAAAVIRGGQAIVPIADSAQALWQEYWDVVGGDGLNEAELAELGVKPETLAATVTLLENFAKFANGEATEPSVYRVTLNKIRRAAARI